MYRVIKALNHNAVLVLDGSSQEYLIMGKGIGFGKKVSEPTLCGIGSQRGRLSSAMRELDVSSM